MQSPADRLEHHMAKEFVVAYINQALTRSSRVVIDPNRIYLAARMAGLKVSTRTLATVLEEMQQ
jgi:hypothetical protein